MKNEYHWMFQHNVEDDDMQAISDTNITRQGPASLPDQSIVYPCNLGHWHECQCESCQLIRHSRCKSHKKHLQFNLDTCLVKESVDCANNKIDHPENVQDDDIVIQKNVLFHNSKVMKHGRNYSIKEVILAGLKHSCRCCRRNTEDHFKNHLTVHPQCELCLFEVKSSKVNS